MSAELLLVIAALAAGTIPMLGRVRGASGPARALQILVALGALGALGAAWASHGQRPAPFTPKNKPVEVPADGYTSSKACRACHPDEYATWRQTYHRKMTQVATPEAVIGDFGDVELTDASGIQWRLFRRGEQFWAAWKEKPREEISQARLVIEALQGNLADPNTPPQVREVMVRDLEMERKRLEGLEQSLQPVERPIVQTTGSHHYQVYWYPSVMSQADRRNKILDKGLYQLHWTPDALQGELLPLPFVYLRDERRWVYREAVFLGPPRPSLFSPWNANCIICHATHGRPLTDFENATARSEVAELGIACEACHGPGRAHIEANTAPHRRYAMHLAGQEEADDTVAQPERFDNKRASQICGQCHSVSNFVDRDDYERNGLRFRPGGDLSVAKQVFQPSIGRNVDESNPNDRILFEQSFWSDGQVRVAGREYNGLIDTACHQRGEMACTTCHKMHGADPNDQLKPGADGDEVCLGCHAPETFAAQAHTHHAPDSPGARCQGCHMPRTVFGLLKGIRSHTIDSPSVKSSVETGRPNACNLCHLDKTLAWSAEHLTAWYKAPTVEIADEDLARRSAMAVWMLKGDAAQRALIAANMAQPEALAASGDDWQAPLLARLLDDPYDAVRGIAGRSLKSLPGFADFEYDYIGPAEQRQQAVARALERWLQQRPATLSHTGDAILLDARGEPLKTELDRLQAARDNRDIILAE